MHSDFVAHGGPDALGTPAHDFSTNANAAGPCPIALRAVLQADPCHYPDPGYTALRARLAAFHGVDVRRLVLASSASEAMFRLTAAAVQLGIRRVWMPPAHYGDVGNSAASWGLEVQHTPSPSSQTGLIWACEPSTPQGQSQAGLPGLVESLQPDQTLVLDCAYAPLRLSGESSLGPDDLARVWQLWSPNKALGLTGVRGAYLLAPEALSVHHRGWLEALQRLSASWPIGSHGLAMLWTWCEPEVQTWVRQSLSRLRPWKAEQLALCGELGWRTLPSETNYFMAQPSYCPPGFRLGAAVGLPAQQAAWRDSHGVKVRDASSFGYPGWIRLGVRPPASQRALREAVLRSLRISLEEQLSTGSSFCERANFPNTKP